MNIKIRNNLWQVGGRGLTDPSDAAAYLVTFGKSAALIDAGTGRDHASLVRNINGCIGNDVRLEYLLLTHCHFDHTGGAQAVKDDYGCLTVAHELEAAYLESGDSLVTAASWYGTVMNPLHIDIKLRQQETVLKVGEGEITAIYCPGHSPGSMVYTTRIGSELVLFGQDVHGPLHSDLLSDEELYLDSLARLIRLDADLLLEGHFGVIEPKREVWEFIDSCITPRPQPCRC